MPAPFVLIFAPKPISIRSLLRTHKHSQFPPKMSSSTKTLIDFFQPTKRIKLTETLTPKSPISSLSNTNINTEPNLITTQVELNKSIAKSKLNLKTCTERLSKAKDEGLGFVKMEELLVEETWVQVLLNGEMKKGYVKDLWKFVEKEIRGSVAIYPPARLIFNALNTTAFDRVKVVIIGQDPYHGPGQAMGLSFSVPEGVKIPSSLGNIFKELRQDLGCSIPVHGNLERWALQGVLLLNTVLTVRSHQANSHAKKGWELFTDAVIQSISLKRSGVVFLLWGNSAQQKSKLIDESKHHVLRAAHPSGLSANRGFFGCRHFSKANQLLEQMGALPIDWQL